MIELLASGVISYSFFKNREVGFASWYGPGFHKKRTASGAIYDMNKLTAAHRTLPFGTRVRVTNLSNNKSVVVTIKDRGPFTAKYKKRIIDLSAKAAKLLKIKGINPVMIEKM